MASATLSCSEPSLVALRFLPNSEKPSAVWEKCMKAQDNWVKERSRLEEEAERMKAYEEKMTVELIWLTNELEDTLPKGLSKSKASEVLTGLLTKAYDEINDLPSVVEPGLNQLIQHLKAFQYICQKPKGSDSLPGLSEELIKQTHHIMMRGLQNEQGMSVNAGQYRQEPVFAGNHTFPSHSCIPSSMKRIVAKYEEKFAQSHDRYELASWLHFNVVTLHPFLDGNGRISRLLWCYSLMRDGQPFPTVLTSGFKRSQKHLVLCLKRDQDLLISKNPHLTTLTVVSVNQAWEDFFNMDTLNTH